MKYSLFNNTITKCLSVVQSLYHITKLLLGYRVMLMLPQRDKQIQWTKHLSLVFILFRFCTISLHCSTGYVYCMCTVIQWNKPSFIRHQTSIDKTMNLKLVWVTLQQYLWGLHKPSMEAKTLPFNALPLVYFWR